MEGRKEGAYGTEGVCGDEPLQLGLWDVEVPADGRERDRHGGHVRGLEMPFIYACLDDACERERRTHIQNHREGYGADQQEILRS